MPGATSWYYRPVNNARYPPTLSPRPSGTPRPSPAFLTQRSRGHTANSLPGRLSLDRSPAETKEFLTYLSRPTMSSRARHENPNLGFTYRNRCQTWNGHYVWHKMDYLADCYRCMWTRHGSVKHSTKI